MAVLRGSCLCGGVRFEVTEPFVRVTHIFVRSIAPWEVLPDDGAERFDVRGT